MLLQAQRFGLGESVVALLGLFVVLGRATAPELRAIYEPVCGDPASAPRAGDCQHAIDDIFTMRGGIGTVPGCKKVSESGNCLVEICNMEGELSSVDFIGIAAAAQAVLAVCQDQDESTEGRTKIEGFQQTGQVHSSAEVILRQPMTGGPGRRRSIAEKRDYAESGSVQVRDQDLRPRASGREYADPRSGNSPYVQTQFGLFRDRGFPYQYVIQQETQTTLRQRIIAQWNRRDGWLGFFNRRALGVEVEANGDRYNLGIFGVASRFITELPIVDREGIIAAFLRLRNADDNPAFFSARIHLADGTDVGMMTLQVNPLNAMPVPERQIFMRPAGSG